jgi:hypothetical protein
MILQNPDFNFGHAEMQVAYHVLKQFICDLKLLGVISVFLEDELRITGITVSEQPPYLANFRSLVWEATQDAP